MENKLGLYAEESKRNYFHFRLFRYYYLYTTEEERQAQKDTDILFFEFEDGRYSIKYSDLISKAEMDYNKLNELNYYDKLFKNKLRLV